MGFFAPKKTANGTIIIGGKEYRPRSADRALPSSDFIDGGRTARGGKRRRGAGKKDRDRVHELAEDHMARTRRF